MALKLGTGRIIYPSDRNYSEEVQKILDEVGSDFSDEDTCEEDFCESSHSTDSEICSDSDEFSDPEKNDSEKKYYYGKNRFKWSSVAPNIKVRTPAHNIVRLPGLRPYGKIENSTPKNLWQLLFTDELLNIVMKWTNLKIERRRKNICGPIKGEVDITSIDELKALLGLLIYTSVFKSNHEDMECLFATDGTGRDIFRAVMTMKRFKFLLSNLRFDNPDDREERKKADPAALISEVMNLFIQNSQKAYTLGTCVCIDEMLVGFRGKCRFKMYMPQKPVKYGLKVFCLTDARNNYAYNAYLYCGKDTDGISIEERWKKFNKPSQAVLRLSKPIFNTNRNVTADNWFSSIELTTELLKNGLTYVGTVKKNKKEIPREFLPCKSREVSSTLYGFTKDITLISFIPKKMRAVVLMSSMHHSIETDSEIQKPEIISFYNRTKGGVDTLDEKCSVYSCSRKTTRWPMALFYRLLDISTVNAYILHQSYSQNSVMTRMEFLKELAKRLVLPVLYTRCKNPRITRELRLMIKRILGKEAESLDKGQCSKETKGKSRKTCRLCPPSKKRKTAYFCLSCQDPICLECSQKLCNECAICDED